MSNEMPEKCPKCGAGFYSESTHGVFFKCYSKDWKDGCFEQSDRCIEGERDRLAARVKELEEVLKPLVAMHTEHKELVDSGDGNGYSDAYYCFYKGQYEHWDKAVAALGEGKR